MFQSGSKLIGNEGSLTVEGLKDCVITGFVEWLKNGVFRLRVFVGLTGWWRGWEPGYWGGLLSAVSVHD